MSEETGMANRLVASRYSLLRELGRGGMGVVWLAADEFLGRHVAVKELRPPRWLTGEELDIHQRRALLEARSAARIHHSNAVTLYEAIPANEQDDAMYLIMEFVEGPTLTELLTRQGPLPSPRVAAFGLQLLDVLGAAHALGIVHRDVKPGNILIAANDQVKLTDFGIAHNMGEPRLTRGGVMGTQAFQAPELFESVAITPAVDVWSLGATLYYATEGRGPFDRDSTGATLRAILLDNLPVPSCERHLASVISHMLQRDPAERATIDQARAELRRVPAHESPTRGPRQAEPIATQPSDAPSPDRETGWNPDAETRRRPEAHPLPDFEPQVRVKRRPRRRRLSRTAIVIAAVVAAAVGGAFGLRAALRGPGTTARSIHLVHPTFAVSPPKSGPASTTVAASGRLSEDTDGHEVAFVNSSKQIVYDYYVSGWHGPELLPGTARADSPIVVSPDGTRAYFIEPNGDVVNDYYVPGSGWQGPGQTGGTAEAGSDLTFSQSIGAGTRSAVVFINPSGRLAYDYYASGWHGPIVLPGTPRAGSPVARSADGPSVYFIESNGDVATDVYTSGSWKGPNRVGGVAEAGSGLAFSPGSSKSGTPPAVVFINASGELAYDHYASGWHGPAVLPGTPRAGSPVVWSGEGTSVYFIRSNGKVATDYRAGPRWKGAYLTGGTAVRDSALTYASGNGTTDGRPNLMFVARDGRLVYDRYANGWHGPDPLLGPRR